LTIRPPVRARQTMLCNDAFSDDEHAREHFDDDTFDFIDEMPPYELIHALLANIRRLETLVMLTREEVNRLTPGPPVYIMTAEDLSDGSYFDSPALKRYLELFGDCAVVPWEG